MSSFSSTNLPRSHDAAWRWRTICARSRVTPNGCRRFLGCHNGKYGFAQFRGKLMGVHRISWMIHHCRPIPTGMEILHASGCFKDCFEPTHLSCGTHAKNMGPDRMRDGTLPHGDSHHAAKIHNHEARQIFNSKGSESQRQRAERFSRLFEKNVTVYMVKKIDTGESFGHVTGQISGRKRARENQQRRTAKHQCNGFSQDNVVYAATQVMMRSNFQIVSHSSGRETQCLRCEYVKGHNDYPVVGICGTQTRAHMVMWSFYHNNAVMRPENRVIRHLCDVRDCVSPHHLMLGTQSENQLDRYRTIDVTNSMALQCPVQDCAESFHNDPKSLARHVRLAHLDWVECRENDCQLIFRTARLEMTHHYQKHRGFRCDVGQCQKMYGRLEHLYRHMRTAHQVALPK